MKHSLPILVFGWMILFSSPLPAIACQGPFPRTSTQEIFDSSRAVFYGRVLDVVEIGADPDNLPFQVLRCKISGLSMVER
ncbi:MAG: hypothetical protein GDA44_07190 [Prochloron sp. SP5CPC1]|nr:hypothetical protein [Candidatus Paraprochloron terpiosi SP5CPC1]